MPSGIQMLCRAFGFVESLPQGELKLAVVYDPAVEESAKDAAALRDAVGRGIRSGGRIFVPILVTVSEFETVQGFEVCFLTSGLGAAVAKVSAVVRTQKILCGTFDVAQVEAGYCALGIRTAPKVEIMVNRASADATGVTFDAAFKMLITQL